MYFLNKNISVNVREGTLLHFIPKYNFGSLEVVVSNVNKFEGFDAEDKIYFGLGKHFYTNFETDVILFDKTSFILQSLRLSHSLIEKKPKNISILEQVDSKKGILELITKNKEDFKNKKPFKFRFYNSKTNTLLSYGKKFLKSKSIDLKLEVAQDVFLLFNQDKKYCGWILENPEKYIVQYYYYRKDGLDSHENFNHIESHIRLKEFYHQTYNLIEDVPLFMMDNTYEDPDGTILKKMNALYIEMNTLESPCIGIIALKDKLEERAGYDYKKRFGEEFGKNQ